MAGLPPNFWVDPPPPVNAWHYLPAGTIVPPVGVAFDDHQIGVITKAYHTHPSHQAVPRTEVLDAGGMFNHFLGDNKYEYLPVKRAVASKLLQQVPYNRVRGLRIHDNVALIFQCWHTCNQFELDPPELAMHPVLRNGRLCKYNSNTIMQLRQMLPVLIFTVIKGPTAQFKKNWDGFDKSFYILKQSRFFNDSEKYALILPILKTLVKKGDQHEALQQLEHVEIWQNRNVGSSYETLCRGVRKFGVYKMSWIKARVDAGHRDYSEDPNVVRRWQNGVRYEVAMVLRYLRPEFPQAPDNMYYCENDDKDNYINRRCYINGVKLPDFPHRGN